MCGAGLEEAKVSAKQELEIRIAADGSVHIEVIGGDGQSCVPMTRALEESLGAVVERELKSEYYGDRGHPGGVQHGRLG